MSRRMIPAHEHYSSSSPPEDSSPEETSPDTSEPPSSTESIHESRQIIANHSHMSKIPSKLEKKSDLRDTSQNMKSSYIIKEGKLDNNKIDFQRRRLQELSEVKSSSSSFVDRLFPFILQNIGGQCARCGSEHKDPVDRSVHKHWTQIEEKQKKERKYKQQRSQEYPEEKVERILDDAKAGEERSWKEDVKTAEIGNIIEQEFSFDKNVSPNIDYFRSSRIKGNHNVQHLRKDVLPEEVSDFQMQYALPEGY